MKIGYVQFEPALANRDTTISRLQELLPRAETADLVVLPELANSGYNFSNEMQAKETAEETEGPFCSMLSKWCAEAGTFLVTGLNELYNGKLYNSAVLISPDGVLGTYRKIHLFNNEKLYFQPGDLGVPVFDVKGVSVSILVCFDWIFPELWRMAALDGAQIICHPSNLVLPGLAQKGVPAHSLMNRVFCITANRIGREVDLHFTGRSIITNARGDVLVEGSPDTAEVTIVDIQPAEALDKQVTERNHLWNDRRPEVYSLIRN